MKKKGDADTGRGKGGEEKDLLFGCCRLPNQQRAFNKLPTELRCRNFVNKHPTEHTKSAPSVQKTCTRRVRVPTELPFCVPPLVVGCQVEGKKNTKYCLSVPFFASFSAVLLYPPLCPHVAASPSPPPPPPSFSSSSKITGLLGFSTSTPPLSGHGSSKVGGQQLKSFACVNGRESLWLRTPELQVERRENTGLVQYTDLFTDFAIFSRLCRC